MTQAGHNARKNAIAPSMTDVWIRSDFDYLANIRSFLGDEYEAMNDILGKGSQGWVCRIRARGGGSSFAFKVPRLDTLSGYAKGSQISPIARICEQFEIEAGFLRKTAKLSGVVDLVKEIKTGPDLGPPFADLVLELMTGSLNTLFGSPPSDEQMVFDFFKKGVDILCHLQRMNIIHGDVKPANWLYKKSGSGTYEFKLTDFGLAKHERKKDNGNGGTYCFAAPEAVPCCSGGVVCKSDLWSHFVTVVWALNSGDIRTKLFQEGKDYGNNLEDYQQLQEKLQETVRHDPRLKQWQNIFELVEDRPSAEKILVALRARTSF